MNTHSDTIAQLRERLEQAGELEKTAFEPMPAGMPPNSEEALAAAAPAPMDPSMTGGAPPMPVDPMMAAGGAPMPPMDPAAGGMPPMPVDPAMGGAPMPPVDPIMELGAQVAALTDTVNAIAAAVGVDPANAGVPAAEAAALEAIAPPPAPLGPEEAAMLEQPPVDPMMAAGGAPMPPVDPALMEAAASQAAPMPAPMMQMTASEYAESEKPEKNAVAHMLLNLKQTR